MNKKAFIRTMEAVIAVIILLSIIYVVTPARDFDISTPNNVEQAHGAIFSEISANFAYRECILGVSSYGAINNIEEYSGTVITDSCLTDINSFININTPNNYVYLAEICSQSAACLDSSLPVEKSIYTQSIMLASENPKVFRIYFWEK
ncbi:MAG: hypothetical protein Q8Q42_02785 [Nanoarchaeota archaeon]|nr:hypothetical protein [Nanoarchaeota archaeon]